MNYEHEPTPGPGVWIGAGALCVVGGLSLVWAQISTVIGLLVAVAGLATLAGGMWYAVRRRD
ncbi:hypothetical protein ACFRFQ_20630 [Rhodococcus sp. NPDC056743]|uniref:hypothetical protein n=1 Tax=Rhodococcus sp. NPDC056743 TaxID=3345934 RepID=UPI003670288D